jgi:microcystin-dependent protein
MTNFYLGQIEMYGFNFAPRGFATCSGQIISIAQNTALFSLLGTTYGGNGQTTFGLPDLQGRAPLHFDNNYPLGEIAGTESVTLLSTEMPSHKHAVNSNDQNGTLSLATGHLMGKAETGKPATPTPTNAYAVGAPNTILNIQSLSLYGGNQPHSNMQPYVVINFSIATTGIFPSRN